MRRTRARIFHKIHFHRGDCRRQAHRQFCRVPLEMRNKLTGFIFGRLATDIIIRAAFRKVLQHGMILFVAWRSARTLGRARWSGGLCLRREERVAVKEQTQDGT